jgi:hypothetical protein
MTIFIIKWSRLVPTIWKPDFFCLGFEWSKQDGCQIMAAILFLLFENRTRLFSSASLDGFGMNKFFWLFSL